MICERIKISSQTCRGEALLFRAPSSLWSSRVNRKALGVAYRPSLRTAVLSPTLLRDSSETKCVEKRRRRERFTAMPDRSRVENITPISDRPASQ